MGGQARNVASVGSSGVLSLLFHRFANKAIHHVGSLLGEF